VLGSFMYGNIFLPPSATASGRKVGPSIGHGLNSTSMSRMHTASRTFLLRERWAQRKVSDEC
jgi:hypothetical protein